MSKTRTNEHRDPHKLKNHPLNIKLYKGAPPTQDFVSSVKAHGILTPLLVTVDDVVISGHDRKNAARMAGLKEVPCVVLRDVTDPLDLEELLIVSNRQKQKDNETLAREAARLAEIEAERSEARQKKNLKKGPESSVKAQAPERETGSSGQTRQKVAEALGVGEKKAEQLAATGKALEQAEAKGDTEKADEIKAGLKESVAAGHRAATAKEETAPPVSDAFGPVPEKLAHVFEAVSDFKGLQKRIGAIQNDIEELQRSDAGAAMPIQEILNAFKNIKQGVKFAIPYCECPKCRRSKKECKACDGLRWITEATFKRCRTEDDEKWLKGDRS